MNLLPLILAAAALAGCATPQPSVEDCRIARLDTAAAEACLAEPNCAAKWGSSVFLMQLDDNRRTVARCEVAK